MPYRSNPVRLLHKHLTSYTVDPVTGCWLWSLSLRPNGYGQLRRNGRTATAHRVFYEVHVRPIPDGMQVLHACDVRRCVNPDHLFLGTQRDNIDDMFRKGRAMIGSRSSKAKLNEDKVREIRAGLAAGKTSTSYAVRFGVSVSAILLIKNGKNWKQVK